MNNHQRIVVRNRAPLSAAAGWIHIVPRGELPNKDAGIVQVLDDTSLDSIMAGIQRDRNRLGDKWPGVYAGREHFIYDAGQDSAALAWFKEFQKRDDGIWARDDGLTPAGVTAIKNREYKFTSFVADPADLKRLDDGRSGSKAAGESGNGLPRYRVLRIETVGFTNFANGKELLTPITNRQGGSGKKHAGKMPALPVAPARGLVPCANHFNVPFAGARASAAGPTQPHTKRRMQTIALTLGLPAEAGEDAILAEVTRLLNRGDINTAELATLRHEHQSLREENQTLLAEQSDALLDACGVKDEKIRNRMKSGLALLKNRAERLGYLADFGYQPGERAKLGGYHPQVRLFNRDTKPPTGKTAIGAASASEEQQLADKVMNRAAEIHRDGRGKVSLATATRMAQRELTETQAANSPTQ